MLAAAIVTAAATVGLAVLAFRQIGAGREQTKVATDAALEIARETRRAAERQWQPRVFAHPWGDPVRGDGHNAAAGEMGVGYRLKNEGTGPAFNVEHGVWVAGKLHVLWQYPSMVAGEELPPMLDAIGLPVKVNPLVVGVKLTEWHEGHGLMYWTRFENLLGERFAVLNFREDTLPAVFLRVP